MPILNNSQDTLAVAEAMGRPLFLNNTDVDPIAVEQSASRALEFALPSTLLAPIDTVAQTLSMGMIDDEDMQEFLNTVSPEFANFYAHDAALPKAVGDIAFAFVPGTLAMKGIQSGSQLHKLVRSITNNNRVANSVFTSGRTVQSIARKAKMDFTFLARERGTVDFSNDTVARLGGTVGGRKITGSRNLIKRAASDGIKKGVAFELGVAGTMNESENLYPDDWEIQDHLALSSLGVIIPTAADYFFTKAALKRAVATATQRGYRARSFFQAPLDEVRFAKNDRDSGVFTYALEAAGNEFRISNQPNLDENLKQAINATNQQNKKEIANQVGFMATDGIPGLYPGRKLDANQRTLVTDSFVADPSLSVGTQTIVNNVPIMKKDLERFARRPAIVGEKQKDKAIAAMEKANADSKAGRIDSQQWKAAIEAADSEFQEGEKIRNLQSFVLETTGELAPAITRFPRAGDFLESGRLKIKTSTDDRSGRNWTTKFSDSNVGGISRNYLVDRNFNILISDIEGLASNKFSPQSLSDLTVSETDVVFELIRRVVDERVRSYKPGDRIIVSETDSWLKLDAVAEINRRNPAIFNNGDIVLPDAWRGDFDLLEYASLGKKFREFNSRLAKNEAAIFKGRQPEQELSDIVHSLNLPKAPFGYGQNPTVDMLIAGNVQGNVELVQIAKNIRDFREMAGANARFPDYSQVLGRTVENLEIRGRSMEPVRKGQPVILVKNPIDPSTINSTAAFQQAAARNLTIRDAFVPEVAERAGARIVARLGDFFVNRNTADQAARNVRSLGQGVGQKGVATSAAFADRYSEAMQGAHATHTNWSLAVTRYLDTELFSPHRDLFVKIRARNNAADLVSFNLFVNSRRAGWDLMEDIAENADGTVSFRVDQNSKFNKTKWKEIFGEELPENALMPEINAAQKGRNQAYAATSLSFELIQAVNNMSQEILTNSNYLRKLSQGVQINRKAWHVPARRMASQHIAYLVKQPDVSGNEKFILTGRTQAQLDAQIQTPVVQERLKSGQYSLLKQEDVKAFLDYQDLDFHEMQDFSAITKQTGRGKGTSVEPFFETDAGILEDIILSIQNNVNNIGRRTTALWFEPQLRYARGINAAEGNKGLTTKSGLRPAGRSIWQNYADTLLGIPASARPGTVPDTFRSIESSYDRTLAGLYDKLDGLGFRGGISATVKRKLAGSDEKQFAELKKTLGNHLPFEDATEYAAAQFQVTVPPTMQQHAATLNRVTSALTLRMFEIGHALLNLTGTAATMPAVMKALHRRTGETENEWRTRVWSFGTPIGSQGLATLNVPKMYASTISYGFSQEGRQVWKEAADLGLLEQWVAEIMRTLHEPHQSFAQSMISRGVDIVSTLSDRSEVIARGWAHLAGHRIATQHLGMSSKRAHIFAQKFANDTIGDYRPLNRPQIFQGAVGMPLGLFQTYMWNYYQRMFSYIEGRDTRALVTQYAMQASVFGAQSVPGWEQFVKLFASGGENNESNIVDGLNSLLGVSATDFLMYGTLSNIPKLFGQDGVALYSRGDVNVRRLPVVTGLQDIPFVSFANNTMDLVSRTWDSFSSAGGFSLQQQLEIMGTYFQNRPIRYIAELASGVSVDRRGQLLEEDTRSGLSIAARLSGLRPMVEAKQLEAYHRVKGIEASRGHKRLITRLDLRSSIRAGTLDEEQIEDALVAYIEQGGLPSNFSGFLRDQYIAALTNKVELGYVNALKGGRFQDAFILQNALNLEARDRYFE